VRPLDEAPLSRTEQRNPRSASIDRMSTLDLLRLINAEDRQVPVAGPRENEPAVVGVLLRGEHEVEIGRGSWTEPDRRIHLAHGINSTDASPLAIGQRATNACPWSVSSRPRSDFDTVMIS